MPKCDFNKVVLQLIEIALRHGCSPVNWVAASDNAYYRQQ